MTRSIHSPEHRRLCHHLLAKAREDHGLTQAALAAKLERPQSFVSKVERGERRLDLIEFIELVEAIGDDPARLVRQLRKA